jgi:hypothetical protein
MVSNFFKIDAGNLFFQGAVTFTATVEDPSGILRIIYDIYYPADQRYVAVSYILRPLCNFNGVTSGTCSFTQSIDHGIQNPTLLVDYVIQTIRIIDMRDNISTYYPEGTVTGGANATHNLTIPVITISVP